MPGFSRQGALQKWARFALKTGLLLTDEKLWASIGEQLRDRVDDVGDEMKRRYEVTTERLQDAHAALRGRSNWAPTINFLAGIGFGVGVGMLLAPASGEETRSAIRNKVVGLGNRAGDVATEAAGYRSRTSSFTGTDGD